MADKPTTAPRKRVRKPQRDPTNALPGLLLKYRRAKGWTMRDLEARTREISKAIGTKDGGLTINLISFWERGVVRNSTLPSLDLVARALGRPLDEFIEALGYELRPAATLYDDARRDRVGRILRIAAEDDLDRIEQMLTLNEAERRAMDAFLASFRREDQA